MSISSNSAPTTETEGLRLRLVCCPFCDIPVKKLRSNSLSNPGRIYYKCMNHNLIPRCRFWLWEEDYANYLRGTREVTMPSSNVDPELDPRIVEQLADLIEQLKKKCHSDKQIKVVMMYLLFVMVLHLFVVT